MQSLDELVKAVCSLESDIIKKRPGIKLVVIDSIAYHFRYVEDEAKVRVQSLKKPKQFTGVSSLCLETWVGLTWIWMFHHVA